MAEQKILISIQVNDKDAKQVIESTSKSVDRLSKAEKELAFQLSDKGKKLAEVNEKTKIARDLNKETAQSNLGLKKTIDPVTEATKKLAELQSKEAVELEKVNQQIKIQKELNTAAAKSSLGLANSKKQVNEELTEEEKLTKKLNYELSEEAKKLAVLNENLKIAKQRNSEYAKSQIQLTQSNSGLNDSVSKGTKGLKQNRAQSGLNNAILIEMGRTASDAQYGFQGMANNIGRIVELGQEFARTGAGGLKGALSTLGKSIMGTGGILIGVQLLISFLPTLQKKFKELRKDSDDLNDVFKDASGAVSNTAGKFEAYIATIQDATTSQREFDNTVRALEKDFPRYTTQLRINGISIEDVKNKTQAATLINDAYRNSILENAMARASQAAIEKEAAAIYQAQIDANLELQEKYDITLEDGRKVLAKYNQVLADAPKTGRARQKFISDNISLEERRIAGIVKSLDKEVVKRNETIQTLLPTYEAERQQIESVSALKKEGIDLTVLEGKATIETNNAVTENLKENVDARVKLTDREHRIRARQLKQTAAALSKASDVFGEQTAANKALRVASATIDTYASADLALSTYPPPFGAIAAAANIAIGLKNVKEILSVKVPKEKSVPSAARGGGATTIQAPDFNVVGASQTSQLAEAVSTQQAKPVRAFVVGKDISTQQELDRNITNTASFG